MKKEYILVLLDIGTTKEKTIGKIKCEIAYNDKNKTWNLWKIR